MKYCKRILALLLFMVLFIQAHAEPIDLLSEPDTESSEYSEESDQPLNNRKAYDLRSVQQAFNESELEDNISEFVYSPKKIYKVKLRLHMNTLIYLPEDEEVLAYTLGDDYSFQVNTFGDKIPNLISIRSDYAGVDTNLNIITKSNRNYSFYIRAYPVSAEQLSDFVVYVKKQNQTSFQFGNNASSTNKQNKNQDTKNLLSEIQKSNDYLKSIEDPNSINTEYKMYGDKDIAPYAVYDDGKWTYFDFRKNFVSDRLPVIYKVIDKYDAVINTRIEKGFLIAESLSIEGWTLRNGDKVVCVKPKKDLRKIYKFENAKTK